LERCDARCGAGAARRVQRDLLADDGCEVAVEREQELLDVAPLLIVLEADARSADLVVPEDVRVQEPEERVDRPVVEEAEAADLRPLETEVQRRDARHVEVSELADLLVEVPQVRDLDDLLLVLEARVTVGPEVPELRLEPVAALAGEAELLVEERARGTVGQARAQGERLARARRVGWARVRR